MSHPVVSNEEWIAARRDLLVKEKELTRARDRLNEARRALPWEEAVSYTHLTLPTICSV